MTLVLITRRSLVQILSPQPENTTPYGACRKGFFLFNFIPTRKNKAESEELSAL